MDLEFSSIKMERYTKDNGWMIFSMVMEMKVGVMDLNIRDSINLEKNMDMVITNGRMDQTSAEIGLIINIKATEPITG
jgi:hypothetical protein